MKSPLEFSHLLSWLFSKYINLLGGRGSQPPGSGQEEHRLSGEHPSQTLAEPAAFPVRLELNLAMGLSSGDSLESRASSLG
jgi:hypothetical protein